MVELNCPAPDSAVGSKPRKTRKTAKKHKRTDVFIFTLSLSTSKKRVLRVKRIKEQIVGCIYTTSWKLLL